MDSLAVQPLLDLCYIRTAYLLLCRNIENTWFTINWRELSWRESLEFPPKFLSDVQRLSFPEKLRLRILNRLYLVVGFLPLLLRSWFPNIPLKGCLELVTGDVLYECLVLKGDGLIDYRKTAQKVLKSGLLDHVFAFRLASVNFLEEEVFQLWFHVKEFFLKRAIIEEFFIKPILHPIGVDVCRYPNVSSLFHVPPYPCTTESLEVLFWIGYCLSRENGNDLSEVPHFAGDSVSWYEFTLDSAVSSSNVACFEYFDNLSHSKIEYNNMDIIPRIFISKRKRQQSLFIFHFMRLNSEEKARLIETCPVKVISHFLQWPVSQKIAEDPTGLWKLIPEENKFWTFLRLFAILFYKDGPTSKLNMSLVLSDWQLYGLNESGILAGIYSLDHLRSIWTKLWEISPDSYKSEFLDTVVFNSIKRAWKDRKFYYKFILYALRRKLYNLFLKKGSAVLELYKCKNLKESLMSLVGKHLPEDLELQDRNCISFLSDDAEQLVFAENNPLNLEYKLIHYSNNAERIKVNSIHGNFLKYIEDNLF